MKFMGFSKSYLPVRFAALALVGAFVASLGVVALPSEAEARRRNVWSVKFKCSDNDNGTDRVQLDNNPFSVDDFWIQTLVNIHNPTGDTVKFKKKVVVALRQHLIDSDDDPSDNVSDRTLITLGPNEAHALDCEDIRSEFGSANNDFGDEDIFGLVEGFVVIESERGRRVPELIVCANYMLAAKAAVTDTAGTSEPTGFGLHNQCYKPIRVRFRRSTKF